MLLLGNLETLTPLIFLYPILWLLLRLPLPLFEWLWCIWVLAVDDEPPPITAEPVDEDYYYSFKLFMRLWMELGFKLPSC